MAPTSSILTMGMWKIMSTWGVSKHSTKIPKVQAYIEHDNEAERELIEAFQVFDTTGRTGTIPAREYLRILTEIGDDPVPVEDVLNEFVELGIELDSEIDYRALAKFMVASERYETDTMLKKEVVMNDASIEDNILRGYAYNHPKLGEGRIKSSSIISVSYDDRATAVETQNTVFIVGPTGWRVRPANHPFNNPYYAGQQVKISGMEGGGWPDIGDKERSISHYLQRIFLENWDEWVNASKAQNTLLEMNEEDICTFRPPEPELRVGVRDSSYLNYRAWGYISEDERILLSDEGEVYMKIDEETFGTNDAIRMMFKIASDNNLSSEKKE